MSLTTDVTVATDALRTLVDAASASLAKARKRHSRQELAEEVSMGADGTPSSLLDILVEQAAVDTTARLGVNLLSEEVGWLDRGSAMTLVVDPVDGTANALAEVPISTCSAAAVVDGRPVAAHTRWLETGKEWVATAGEADGTFRTTRARRLGAAAISLLRPKPATWDAWRAVAERAGRIRVLSCSTFEGILVCTGAIDAFADPGGDVHRYVDLVAAQLYAELAGAVVVDVHGRPIDFDTDLTRRWSGVVAASPALADELVAAILDAGPIEVHS